MSIKVALTHRTTYSYDRPTALGPHVVRLRPAPHARTPIESYSLKISPPDHFINWQQDAFANWQARLVFPEKIRTLEVTVDLVAQMVALNPFDFFLEDAAQEVPFAYDAGTGHDLGPYLKRIDDSAAFRAFVAKAPPPDGVTIDWLVALNQYVQNAIAYTVRMEPGVQTPTQTIERALGSCRDSGWLLAAVLREFGYAARFVSGYLIQLTADLKAVDGPSGPEADFTDLHAWTEVYLPGAGWVGLDPTSGLFAGEGHIPLAATPEPGSAAAITGAHEPAEVSFAFEMQVTRVAEPPRVTRPLTPTQWAEIDRAGRAIDDKLTAQDVRLTMGGEPTFVSDTDRDAEEWTTDAVGPTKRAKADALIRRLQARFAPDGVLHHGQGKWYPGEQLPRWAFSLIWRGDGVPLWTEPTLIAPEGGKGADHEAAGVFAAKLAEKLALPADFAQPVYEDPMEFLGRETLLPENVTPEDSKLADPQERARLARVFSRGFGTPVGYVIPLQLAQAQAVSEGSRRYRWASEKWQTRRGHLFTIPGDSPVGFRLPLAALNWLGDEAPVAFARDPMAATGPLPPRRVQQSAADAAPAPAGQGRARGPGAAPVAGPGLPGGTHGPARSEDWIEGEAELWTPGKPIRTALTVEPRDGIVHVFYPPTGSIDEFLDLLSAVEETATELGVAVRNEGYEPPRDPRVNIISVTPDPGVIEVNIHPSSSWTDLGEISAALYEEARQCGLDSISFMVDGRIVGSGGGNHIVVGGAKPADSPFLRRPDLLASIIGYWQAHPSLSYLFSGTFIGPTSQAPRFDEGRPEAIYEMEIAMVELDRLTAAGNAQPWLVDRLFRHLLTDMTGNTHRAEICIDKLFSPDGSTGRLGLVEFRGFEMPPHWQMSMAQALVLRALIAWFWDTPWRGQMNGWGTALHDRFLLPDPVWADFGQVLGDLSAAHGMTFAPEWFAAQREFRFPVAGRTEVAGVGIELRNAIEPWLTLGEEQGAGGTARYVDSSVERVQVRLTNHDPDRYTLACNGLAVPLHQQPDGAHIAGIRFRAWQPWSAMHPTIPAHGPLVFDLYDRFNGRSVGGCTYHVVHPGGRAHEDRPINALEAEGRRLARFDAGGHTPGAQMPEWRGVHPAFPYTLDLRRG
ncbi:MAG: transglutaminase family protein [Rhodobacteraceae bacterium]|nr:transglutaminase family protein [Paracoccaceae bacterium]